MSDKQLPIRLLYTVEQSSKILGDMPPSTIRRFVHRGLLRRVPGLDRPWYFTIEDLEDFIERLKSGSFEKDDDE